MGKKIGHQKPQASGAEHSWLNIFNRNHKWEDKDEVLDAVYWLRQIIAIFMGMIWGFLGVTGLLGIISFAILNSLAAYTIANKTGYDFEPEDNLACIKEGFMTTFATFLVTWIVAYTAAHFNHL